MEVIEHDGSLSRNDIYFGNNFAFNPKIFAPVAKILFAKDKISIATAAKARRARITAAAAANPVFNFTAKEDRFSQFESALYLGVFGKGTEGNAKSRWVEVMFRTFVLLSIYAMCDEIPSSMDSINTFFSHVQVKSVSHTRKDSNDLPW